MIKVWSVRVGDLYRGRGRNRATEALVTPIEIPVKDAHIEREGILSGRRVLTFQHFGEDVSVPVSQVQLLTLSDDRKTVEDVEYFNG